MKRLFFLVALATFSFNCIASIVPSGSAISIIGPTTITLPGTYTLARDIVGTVTIAASQVIFNLNNHSIDATGQGNAIFVDTQRDISIANGFVSNAINNGIFIESCMNVQVSDVVSTNNDTGIRLNLSSECTLKNCECSDNTADGIDLLEGCHNNIIISCNSYRNLQGIGIFFQSTRNTISNCLTNNNNFGIVIDETFNNLIDSNQCKENLQSGITLQSTSSFNTVSNCIANDNNDGIQVLGATNNNLFKNVCSGNDEFGIEVQQSSNNTLIVENTCSNNNLSGIATLSNSNNCCIKNNIANNNTNFGFQNSGSDNSFFQNKAQNNGMDNYSGVPFFSDFSFTSSDFIGTPTLYANISVIL